MIYIIITTALVQNNFEIRKQHYINGINSLLKKNKGYKIIIVEGNGERRTFLDDFGVDVVYTSNNINRPFNNTGHMEMKDIHDVISKYNIQDDDFIVKLTGRYFIDEISPFFDALEIGGYECIIKYGNYAGLYSDIPINDCICSLIGMTGKYMKMVKVPKDNSVSLETNFANVALLIPRENQCILQNLGIYIAPSNYKGFTNFFLV